MFGAIQTVKIIVPAQWSLQRKQVEWEARGEETTFLQQKRVQKQSFKHCAKRICGRVISCCFFLIHYLKNLVLNDPLHWVRDRAWIKPRCTKYQSSALIRKLSFTSWWRYCFKPGRSKSELHASQLFFKDLPQRSLNFLMCLPGAIDANAIYASLCWHHSWMLK